MKEIFKINGIRTNNFSDQDILSKITESWTEALSYQSNNDLTRYGIYTNYQSDFQGDYDFICACDHNLANFEAISIPKQNYQEFKVDSSIENAVFIKWQEIWSMPLDRSYLFDYEQYNSNGSIIIYIGLK